MTATSTVTSAPQSIGFWGAARKKMFGLGDKDVAPLLAFFAPAAPDARQRLTDVVNSFVDGYNVGLVCHGVTEVVEALDKHVPERAGFAWEGAGMSVALRALMIPGAQLFAEYLKVADRHHYIVHIGAGWAMARFPLRHGALRAQMCPTYHWLAWDGFGFHEAMFKTDDTLVAQKGRPSNGFAANAFDHGVGRALWFVCGARPDVVLEKIAAFPQDRRGDLWGGVGLAITYAGGVEESVLDAMIKAAGEHRYKLGIGSALAAQTRLRAGNATPYTAMAAKRVTGMEMESISSMIATMEAELGSGDDTYPEIRRRLEQHMQEKTA